MPTTRSLIETSMTFPELPVVEIRREQLSDWLNAKFSSQRKVLLLQGAHSGGKTTLLAQFVRSYPTKCISFFVGTDLWSSSPEFFLHQMCSQMAVAIRRKLPDDFDGYSEFELKRQFEGYYRRLAKLAENQGPYFFVVDGLDRVKDNYGGNTIINLLPTDPLKGIYLLLSSTPNKTYTFKHETERIIAFSQIETEAFLENLGLSREEMRSIHSVCGGLPGYLAEIRRQIELGVNVESLLADLPAKLSDLFARAWQGIGEEDNLTTEILSVIAYGESQLTVDQLSNIVEKPVELLRQLLSELSILQEDEATKALRFISDAHHEFALTKLVQQQQKTLLLLIDYYGRDRFSEKALIELPILYKKTDGYEQLRALVDVDYLLNIVEQPTPKFSIIRRNSRLLVAEAAKRQDLDTLSFFTLIGSTMTTLVTRATAETEVEALLELGRYDETIQLANGAILQEDRLQLLAKVASHLQKKEVEVPQGILEDLRLMVTVIQTEDISKERALEIATDLFYLLPQSAMELIEKVSGTEGHGKAMDALLATLSLRVADEAGSLDSLSAKIQDSDLQTFVRANSPVVAQMTAEQVIGEAKKILDTSARLFMLRSWCNENREHQDAMMVVHEALEIMTVSADYSASLLHLRQFAEPLRGRWGSDIERAIERLDILANTAIQEPAEEYIRLQMLLATVEATTIPDRAEFRVISAYEYLDNFPKEMLDKYCYALVRILISLPDASRNSSDIENLEKQLTERLSILLENSADQLTVTRQLLRTLTLYKPQLALNLADKLNTDKNRDKGRFEILLTYVDKAQAPIELHFVQELINHFQNQRLKDIAIVRTLEVLTEQDFDLSQLTDFISGVEGIADPATRCFGYSHLCQIATKSGQSNHVGNYFEGLKNSWSLMDRIWEQAVTGFKISSILADKTSELASQMFDATRSLRLTSPQADEVFAQLYISTLRLAIRSFMDVLKGEDYVQQRDGLVKCIHLIQSFGTQAELLANLSLAHFLCDKEQDFKALLQEAVEILEGCKDTRVYVLTIIAISPALYRFERTSLLQTLSPLLPEEQDAAISRVIDHLLTGSLLDDPVNLQDLSGPIVYEEVLRATDLLRSLNSDATIYFHIKKIVSAIISLTSKNKHKYRSCKLPEKQALAIANQLKNVIESKLPDPTNISHDGYKIAANAEIARLRDSVFHQRAATTSWSGITQSWEDIAKEARQIPNIADRVFVLSGIGPMIYFSDNAEATAILNEAQSEIYQIPNLQDRADRLENLADSWKDVDDEESAKILLREALTLIEGLAWEPTRDQAIGHVLQLAHSISPEFASSLTSTLDNPMLQMGAEADITTLSLHQQPDRISHENLAARDQHEILGKAAWKLLESLRSGRGTARASSTVGEWLSNVVDAEFNHAYPVIVWSIENRIAQNKSRKVVNLGGTYRNLITALRLIHQIGEKLTNAKTHYDNFHISLASSDAFFFSSVSDHGSKATDFLEQWLSQEPQGYVEIYDPYFTSNELHFLKNIQSDIRVTILTTMKALKVTNVSSVELEQNFRDAWKSISDQPPPDTTIYVVGITSNGESPMHDRYVITEGAGLHLGSSLGGIDKKQSNIRSLGADEAIVVQQELIAPLVMRHLRLYKNEPLLISTLTLA